MYILRLLIFFYICFFPLIVSSLPRGDVIISTQPHKVKHTQDIMKEDDGNVDDNKRFDGIGPAWTYDKNVEKPEGVEDRESCTLRVYTKEQQDRLHIDKFGEPKKKESIDDDEIIILKIGGSSITNKALEETLNQDALDWFAKLVTDSIDRKYLSIDCSADKDDKAASQTKKKTKFIIVHGAGSFGHHSAKRYGLQCGKDVYIREKSMNYLHQFAALNEKGRRLQSEGLCKTRQSVQKLNSATVSCLIKHGVNAVSISPGISLPNLRAHGAIDNDSSAQGMQDLCASVEQALEAGLVPVLHGDACLLYDNIRAGILGGDTIVEGLATVWNKDKKRRSRISKVIFITDVDGVYSSDPKSNDDADLIRSLKVDRKTGDVTIERVEGNTEKSEADSLNVSGSSHDHDVTGGLKAKLSSAVSIVQSGVDVIISQCNSSCTRQLVRGEWNSIWDVKTGTLLTQQQ